MYEHHKQSLIKPREFYLRLLKHVGLALILIFISVILGMCGYHYIAGLAWIDAFLDACMILSGMGQVSPLTTNAAKIFAGLYAIYSGLLFISVIAIVLIPVWHRIIHKFHVPSNKL